MRNIGQAVIKSWRLQPPSRHRSATSRNIKFADATSMRATAERTEKIIPQQATIYWSLFYFSTRNGSVFIIFWTSDSSTRVPLAYWCRIVPIRDWYGSPFSRAMSLRLIISPISRRIVTGFLSDARWTTGGFFSGTINRPASISALTCSKQIPLVSFRSSFFSSLRSIVIV